MSQLKNEVEVLKRVPLFSGVDAAKLKLLAFTSKVVRFKAGEVVFRQNDPGDSAYVILAGTARVYVDGPDGEIELAEVGETDFVGEIAILCDVPRTASVAALTDVTALRLGKETFAEFLVTFPTMSVAMMRELAFRLSRTTAELVASERRHAHA